MTSTELEASITGSWVTTTSPNLGWEGVLRTTEPYALLLVARLPATTSWAKSLSRGAADLPVRLHVHSLGSDDRTQFIFMAGDGRVQNVVVKLPPSAGLPSFCAPRQLEPGLLHPIFVASSEPTVSLGLLLLRRSEVSVGRTGIWRLRKPLAELPTEVLASANAGRAGTISHD